MYPAGVAGITVRYIPVGQGVSVRVVESGPPDLEEAVLLVHGWGGCVYSFAETIPALAAAGHRVVAFDLPGHGLSDKPITKGLYTTRALSDVVLAVATAMNLRSFTFVGHSMGASLGLELAARGEPRLRRLVLVAPVGVGRVPIIQPLRMLPRRVADALAPHLVTRMHVELLLRFAFGTKERPTERDIDEYWAPTQFPEYALACRASAHEGTWKRLPVSSLKNIRLPVLVISGGRDRIVLGTRSRAELIAGAHVSVLPGGGHIVLQDFPDETNAEILAFLRSTKPLS